MKCDIVLAGVGGQGILSIAAIIGQVAVREGLYVKQSEVHGMSQRGGAVTANLRLSSTPIFSDLIAPACADVLLAMEPMEALRQAVFLAPNGVLITNTTPVINMTGYPDLEKILAELRQFPRALVLDGENMAKEAGASARSVNMLLLGAISNFLHLPEHLLTGTIAATFARKGDDVVKANLNAFKAGRASAVNL